MAYALKKITAVLLTAALSVFCAGCSGGNELQQPEPDISDTASVAAAGEPQGSEAEETDVTTASTSATTTTPVTTATTTSVTTTAPPPVTTTTSAVTTTKPTVTTTTAPPPVSASSSDFTQEVFRLVNQIRAEYGLPAFKQLDALTGAAQKRAQELSGFYSHNRPNGQPSYTVMKEFGLEYRLTGENIAAGQMTPQEVVNAWMSSTVGHREAILSSDYRYMGVGYVCLTSGDSQGYKYYWTQEFYTPFD